jgi:hypothetical protein
MMTNQQIAEGLRLKFKIHGNLSDEELIKRFIPGDLSALELQLIKEKATTVEQLLISIERHSNGVS